MLRLGWDGPRILNEGPAASVRCLCGKCGLALCPNMRDVLLEGGRIWMVPASWVVETDEKDLGDVLFEEADRKLRERWISNEKKNPVTHAFACWANAAAARGTILRETP